MDELTLRFGLTTLFIISYILGIVFKIYNKKQIISIGILLIVFCGLSTHELIHYRSMIYDRLVEQRDLAEDILTEAIKSKDDKYIKEALDSAEKANSFIYLARLLNEYSWQWDLRIDDRVYKLKLIELYDDKERV